MPLRDYQQEAVSALLTAPSRSLVTAAVGAGKTWLMAGVAETGLIMGQRVLILAHNKELIAHDSAAARVTCGAANVGICAASVGRSDTFRPVTVAMAQTLVNRLNRCAPFDTILIDEAHRVPHGSEGQYHKVIEWAEAARPDVRILGLTATPYRHPRGMLTEGEDRFFDQVVYEIGMRYLTEQGYLVPMVARSGLSASIDLKGVRTVAGEYDQKGLGMAAMRKLAAMVASIADRAEGRRSILVFASSLEHAAALTAGLREAMGRDVEMVDGASHSGHRDAVLARFKSGTLRVVVNCALWTTGLDVPGIDMVVLARATQSRNLFVQMLGRGSRPVYAAGEPLDTVEDRLFAIQNGPKPDCLLLDLGGNVERFGDDPDALPESRGPGGGGEAPVVVCQPRTVAKRAIFGCGAFSPGGCNVCRTCGEPFESKGNVRVSSIEGAINLTKIKTVGDWVLIIGARLVSKRVEIDYGAGTAKRRANFGETKATVAEMVGQWALVRGETLHGVLPEVPATAPKPAAGPKFTLDPRRPAT